MTKSLIPQTLKGLARLLAKHSKQVILVPEINSGPRQSNKILIVISRIPEFKSIRKRSGKISFGTGATLGQVLTQIQGENGLLKQALSMVANPLIRNRVTVYEGLDPESPYFDLSTALVTLRAKIRLQSVSGSRILGIENYLLEAAEGFKKGEFPSRVEFPVLDSKDRVGFFRVSPGAGKNTVSASIRTKLNRNIASRPEIVVSSTTIIPVQSKAAEKALAGGSLNDTNVKIAAAAAATEMLEIADLEENPYERSLIEVAVSRAIKRVLEVQSAKS